ncbi:MAG: HU family DNA-binding protein [Actinobacteria bacterium]|nr:HU family DNA-binding protein [Actinomycetota bacterium]MCL5444953.1 HU family DNA-binding protein [Actinomycetota bacterium]
MNKPELVAAISSHTGVDGKSVAAVLNGFEAVVTNSVKKGEKVALTGFLSFERVERKARTARNPQTGEPIKVKASKAPRVSVGASFKKIVNGQAPAPKLLNKKP